VCWHNRAGVKLPFTERATQCSLQLHRACYSNLDAVSVAAQCIIGPILWGIAVPSVTRCSCRCRCRRRRWRRRCRRHRCAAARSGEWAQHFSNVSCFFFILAKVSQDILDRFSRLFHHAQFYYVRFGAGCMLGTAVVSNIESNCFVSIR